MHIKCILVPILAQMITRQPKLHPNPYFILVSIPSFPDHNFTLTLLSTILLVCANILLLDVGDLACGVPFIFT